MAYKNSRPESAKGLVYSKYMAEGADAATAFAATIASRKITPQHLARWFKKWGAASPAPLPSEPSEPTSGGKRVYSINDLKMTGTIVRAGQSTSEIKWDDPNPWGAVTSQPNTFLRPIGTNPITPNERAVFLGASHFVVMDMMKPIVSTKKGGPRPKPLPTFDTFADAKKSVGKNKSLSVHAVTKGGNSVLLLRSLWLEYDKLGVQS